jgi:hypothetical protein
MAGDVLTLEIAWIAGVADLQARCNGDSLRAAGARGK